MVWLNARKNFESLGISTFLIIKISLVWQFKARNFDIGDGPRYNLPIEVGCQQLSQTIDKDRNVSIRTITLELDVCQKEIVIQKRINITFNFNCCLPHELTAEGKWTVWLSWEIKGKKTFWPELWPEMKNGCTTKIDAVWLCSASGQSAGSVGRRVLTNKKMLLCKWLDYLGIIYQDYLKRCDIYSNMQSNFVTSSDINEETSS